MAGAGGRTGDRVKARMKKKSKRYGAAKKPGVKERTRLRIKEAVKLRAHDRLSYRAIAERLGVSLARAYALVAEGMKEVSDEIEANGWNVHQQRFQAVDCLQELIGKYLPIATAPGILREKMEDGTVVLSEAMEDGVDAAMVVVNATKEVAKILGLNAPVKVAGKMEHTHRTPVSLEELAERVGALSNGSELAATLARVYAPKKN